MDDFCILNMFQGTEIIIINALHLHVTYYVKVLSSAYFYLIKPYNTLVREESALLWILYRGIHLGKKHESTVAILTHIAT